MCVPKFDASIGVEFRVGVDLVHCDADSTGAGVAAEVIAEVPGRQQTHLEHASLIGRANVSRHEQHHAG